LAAKHRSQRGSLTSKIKEAIFSVFGEANLPPISTNESPQEISRWKKNPAVRSCYLKLHKPVTDDENVTYVLRIIEKVFVSPVPNLLIAFAMSVCDIFLNPDDENIQITESAIKIKLKEYSVSFEILCK
jgi:hypothetical protein